MADTTYVDGSTLLTADTMNDLNRLHYTILGDPADAAAVRTAIGAQASDADIPTVSASQAEMEAGTEVALRSMSPLRVSQAIAALASASSKLITFSFDASLSANFSVAGVGFTPTSAEMVFVKAGVGAGYCHSTGFSDSAKTDGCVVVYGATGYAYDASIGMFYDGSNANKIGVVSYDADGATFSRTVTSSPTGTCNGYILFRR